MTAPEIKAQPVVNLVELHLATVRASFEVLADMARREAITFENFLLERIEREQEARGDSHIQRMVHESRLPFDKTLESFDEASCRALSICN